MSLRGVNIYTQFPKPKRNPLSGLQRKADAVFSHYIRFSAICHHGVIQCYTCGRWYTWQRMEAGHYIGRECHSLRYDERNVHPQCAQCNKFKEGNKVVYKEKLIAQYGINAEDYFTLRKKNRVIEYRFLLEAVIAEYTPKVAAIVAAKKELFTPAIIKKYLGKEVADDRTRNARF